MDQSLGSVTERSERERLSLLLKNAVVMPGQDKKRLYGNTFKMQPDVPFSSTLVEKILKEMMQRQFENHVYDEEKSLKLCITLSVEIRNRVRFYSIFFI